MARHITEEQINEAIAIAARRANQCRIVAAYIGRLEKTMAGKYCTKRLDEELQAQLPEGWNGGRVVKRNYGGGILCCSIWPEDHYSEAYGIQLARVEADGETGARRIDGETLKKQRKELESNAARYEHEMAELVQNAGMYNAMRVHPPPPRAT